MTKLLYITCDLRTTEESCCLLAGQAFLDEYLQQNPGDEVHMLDLYRDPIQSSDQDVLTAMQKTACGHHMATLMTSAQKKLIRIWKLSGQFAAAEKYILVTPMVKPGFPVDLWKYLDTILVEGKTYRNSPDGPEGLFKGQGKKCFLIHSSEGFTYGGRDLHCVLNLKGTMAFLGIEDFRNIVINGFDPTVKENSALVREEIEKVTEAAKTF